MVVIVPILTENVLLARPFYPVLRYMVMKATIIDG